MNYDGYDDYDDSGLPSWHDAVRALEDAPAAIEQKDRLSDDRRYAGPNNTLLTWEEWESWREARKAQAEIAWDLGVSLPAGHPFAPVVDGKQAA